MRTTNSRRMRTLHFIVLMALLGCQGAPAAAEAPGLPSSSTVTRSSGQSAAPPVAPSPVVAPPCPEDPIEAGDLIPMDWTARMVCFGDQPITVVAYVPWQEHVCGDTGIEPSWLGGCSEVINLHHEASDFGVALPARVHPSTGLQAFSLPQRRWVRVTGHHDDPAALSCRETPQPGTIAEPVDATILECRRQFVITDLREVAAP